MTKYTVTCKPGDTIPFWHDCCRLNQPFVTIEDKAKYSLVSWDCISLSSTAQSLLRHNSANIAAQLRQLHKSYSRDPLSSQFIDVFTGYIRTEKTRARELAGLIYDALTTRGSADRIERPLPLGVRQAW